MSDGKTKLVEFAKEVIHVAFEGGSLDGGDIQEMALKHGLIAEERFDPKIHKDTFGNDAAPGDQWFVFAGPLASDFPNPLAHMEPTHD
ncbi:hypothetical protein J2T08_003647 [Neorhizobium galegae]|uniref:hypothetical protein n=1 Tax=Neorhizobium galegae TaxID=399 RepID=UPI00278358B4|nr:hypothetical protein [Neorhizobium galegae]MDQ0135726.1 hypothetical protein [Neorhizobium galegae]